MCAFTSTTLAMALPASIALSMGQRGVRTLEVIELPEAQEVTEEEVMESAEVEAQKGRREPV